MRLGPVDLLRAILKDQQAANQAMLTEQRETNRLLRKLAGEGEPNGNHGYGHRAH